MFLLSVIDFLNAYWIAVLVFFAIDIVWLGLIAKKLYAKELGFIMAKKVKWSAALIFYFIFVAGLVFFVVMPAVDTNSFLLALLGGFGFGLVTYATYDLTNLATLDKWPLKITIIDLIWGSSLGALVAVITFLIVR